MDEEIKEEYQKETVFERAIAAQTKAGGDAPAYNPNEPKRGFLSYDDHRPLKQVRIYPMHKAKKDHDAAFGKTPVDEHDYEDEYKKPTRVPADKGWETGHVTYQEDRNGKPIEGHLHPIHKAKKDPAAAFEKIPVDEKSLYERYTKREHKYK